MKAEPFQEPSVSIIQEPFLVDLNFDKGPWL